MLSVVVSIALDMLVYHDSRRNAGISLVETDTIRSHIMSLIQYSMLNIDLFNDRSLSSD